MPCSSRSSTPCIPDGTSSIRAPDTMMLRHTTRTLVVIPFTTLVLACGSDAPPAEHAVAAPSHTVKRVRHTSLRRGVLVNGVVQPERDATWVVNAPTPTRVAEVFKVGGDEVTAGELLVRFQVDVSE